VAAAKRTRRKQTKKRDEIVTPGPNRWGYLGKDSRPIARNPKYGEAGASPVRGISTGLSPCQLRQRRLRKRDCTGLPWWPPRGVGENWVEKRQRRCFGVASRVRSSAPM